MSFPRVKPTGWSLSEPMTPAHANQLDIDHANSVDKVGGDTISGDITHVTGAHVIHEEGSNLIFDGGTTQTLIDLGQNATLTASASGAKVRATAAGSYIEASGLGRIRTTASGRILLDDSDFPLLGGTHAARSRTVRAPATAFNRTPQVENPSVSPGFAIVGVLDLPTTPAIFNGTALQVRTAYSGATTTSFYAWLADLGPYVHDGATLASVSVQLYAPTAGTYRILVVRQDGTLSMNPPPATALMTGYYGEWVAAASGTTTLVGTCSQNQTIVKSLYNYFALVFTPSGAAGPGAEIRGLTLSMTGIADMRFA